MKRSSSLAIWVLAGILFACGTVWVHYHVKVRMVPGGGGGSVQQAGALAVGEEIPDFVAAELGGTDITLSDFRNREVVMLDFWATWCQPCILGMPSLQAMHEEFDERGLEILAVNLGEDPDTVSEFMEDWAYTFRVVMDPDELVSGKYGVRGIPQLVVVDLDGRVAHIELGYAPDLAEAREKRLRELLERLAPAAGGAVTGSQEGEGV